MGKLVVSCEFFKRARKGEVHWKKKQEKLLHKGVCLVACFRAVENSGEGATVLTGKPEGAPIFFQTCYHDFESARVGD